jgi:hypothetical protein
MKLYTSKRSPNTLAARYVVFTYDEELDKLTYSERRAVPPGPAPDHPIFETNPDFVYQPENTTNINGVDYFPAKTIELSMGKIKREWAWSERSIYIAASNRQQTRIVGPFNLNKETLATRGSMKEWLDARGLYPLFLIYVPYVSGEDLSILTFTADDPKNVLVLNGNIEKIELGGIDNPNHIEYVRGLVFPDIVATAQSTITKDSTAEVTVELRNKNTGELVDRSATVYLDPVVGSVNKTRVEVVNGTGKFIVTSDHLSVGDTLRIKLGWKLWPGVADVFMTVVE